jgi:hypothetical protein
MKKSASRNPPEVRMNKCQLPPAQPSVLLSKLKHKLCRDKFRLAGSNLTNGRGERALT